MKIAIIRRKFTAFGGAENFILRASSGLSQLGINFLLFPSFGSKMPITQKTFIGYKLSHMAYLDSQNY